jgi:prenyltransferase beta subunit/outer membrane protein assembly factor BamB
MTLENDQSELFRSTRVALQKRLLDQRGADGLWTGHLSSSAVSTAVSAIALDLAAPEATAQLVTRCLQWLVSTQTAEGGWGDTPESPANLSATLLARAALQRRDPTPEISAALIKSAAWLVEQIGGADEASIRRGVLKHYGQDRTFAVPILIACNLGAKTYRESSWRGIPPLPFELALLPTSVFKFLRLPVVSYAIPALIAVGLAQHRLSGSRRSPWYRLREWPVKRLLKKLAAMQPTNGGFLEAAPLTAFVVMALCAAGEGTSPIVRRGLDFLIAGARPDGSWPIDSNLNLWLTSLSVDALGPSDALEPDTIAQLDQVYAKSQYREIHPFTKAAPGGWGWTTHPGGVPDADDTAGALMALSTMNRPYSDRVEQGLTWLLNLSNSDGGIPTFCRGWGQLPFDRSCPDLSAHALSAYAAWHDQAPPQLQARLRAGMSGILRYLRESRDADGVWSPLWFGDQHSAGHRSRVYGSAVVLKSLAAFPAMQDVTERAARWLVSCQNADGGWGGEPAAPSTLETTGRAVAALAMFQEGRQAARQGALWICNQTLKSDGNLSPSPVGLYFASLWYAETLYPLVFCIPALWAVERNLTIDATSPREKDANQCLQAETKSPSTSKPPMNSRKIDILTTLVLAMLGAAMLYFWQERPSSVQVVYSLPGMDGAPKDRGQIAQRVVIGEFFEEFDQLGSSAVPGSWGSFRGGDGTNICADGVSLAEQWPAEGPRVLWQKSLGEGHAGVALHQGRVFLLDYLEESDSDAMRCFALDDGRELWRRWYKVPVKRNHGKSRTVPAVNDRVLVSMGPKCHVMALRPESGELLWTLDLVRDFGATVPQWYTGQCPLLDGQTAVLAPGGTQDLMLGVEGETGEILWRVPNPGKWSMSHASVMIMTLAGKRMYVYAALGGVVGVSAEAEDRGATLWTYSGWRPSVQAPTPVALGPDLLFLTAGYGAGSAVLKISREADKFTAREVSQCKPKDGLALEQQSAIFWRGLLWGILPKDAGADRQQLVACPPDDITRLTVRSGRNTRFGLGPFLVADEKIFVLSDDGLLSMFAFADNQLQPLAEFRGLTGHDAWAPLAMANGLMVLRDSKTMICIDLKKQEPGT